MKFLSNGIYYFAVLDEEYMNNAPGKMLKCKFAIYSREIQFSFKNEYFFYVPYTIYSDLKQISEEEFKAHIKEYAPIVWKKLKEKNGEECFALHSSEMGYRAAYCHYFLNGEESFQEFYDNLEIGPKGPLKESVGILKDLLTTKEDKETWISEMSSTIEEVIKDIEKVLKEYE